MNMKNAKQGYSLKEEHMVLPLLVAVVFSSLFLFAVAWSNASFQGEETPFPDPFGPASISANFDQSLNQVADNITWSVSVASQAIQPQVMAFLGLDDYKYGQPRYTAIASQAEGSVEVANVQPAVSQQQAVLGASIVNTDAAVNADTQQ